MSEEKCAESNQELTAESESHEVDTISIEEVKSDLLKDWLMSFSDKKLKITKEIDDREGKDTYRIMFYTEKHKYSIRAVVGRYLGCVMTNRAPYPGEDHTRASDFPDGDFSFSTWLRIVYKILSYELVDIYKPKSAGIG